MNKPELSKWQRSQMPGAMIVAKAIANEVIVLSHETGDRYYWVRDTLLYPEVGVHDAPSERQIMVSFNFTWRIDEAGHFERFPDSMRISYAFRNGMLCASFRGDWLEYELERVTDTVETFGAKQWWAACPDCGKRHPAAWFRRSYDEAKEKRPKPPLCPSLPRVTCHHCDMTSDYSRWSLTVLPPRWLLRADKPVALKGVVA